MAGRRTGAPPDLRETFAATAEARQGRPRPQPHSPRLSPRSFITAGSAGFEQWVHHWAHEAGLPSSSARVRRTLGAAPQASKCSAACLIEVDR